MQIITPKSREEFLKNLKSDKGTHSWYEENKDHLDFGEREKARFLKDIQEGYVPPMAICIYGPEEDGYANGYIDKGYPQFPDEGGTFTKYYGCPFKQKGMHPRDTVMAMQFAKYLFSDLPKHIWLSSRFLTFLLGLGWMFHRNGFLRLALKVLISVEERIINNFTIRTSETIHQGKNVYWDEKWYNKMEREVERCLVDSAKGEGLWEPIFRIIGKFFKVFFYIDNTYKSRAQDALSEGKDLWGTLEVLLQREHGPIRTWRYTKWILKAGLLTSPALKRIVTKFFRDLDREKMRMDLDDKYFCATYRSYDFEGKPYEERRKLREEMNRKYHVVFL